MLNVAYKPFMLIVIMLSVGVATADRGFVVDKIQIGIKN
jgi:hypothetical protein